MSRVRANEKVVAIVSALGIGAGGISGTAAFAMMWVNIQNINTMMNEPPVKRHPEAPAAGDEVMYVDLSRERLESLYKGDQE